jgi:nucleotide-binding universal stress UspA family protein
MSGAGRSEPGTPSVVVGVDGSIESIEALRRGASLAARLGARLEAVTAWHYQMVLGTFVPVDYNAEATARAALDAAIEQAFGAETPPGFTSRTIQGRPKDVLVDAARDAEMLVVASHGTGRVAGAFIGSVAHHLVGHCAVPVLVVPVHDHHPAHRQDPAGA